MTDYKSDFMQIMAQRGFLHQCSDAETLDKKLSKGTMTAYVGFDATATSLHIGNLLGIMMLRWFQKCGHKPITLMGGGTRKSAIRPARMKAAICWMTPPFKKISTVSKPSLTAFSITKTARMPPSWSIMMTGCPV